MTSLKVKLKLPNSSSPGRVVVTPSPKRPKKRHEDESKAHKKRKIKTEHVEAASVPERKPVRPNYSDMQRVIDHLQKQDRHSLFKDPVTDDVAPGYSKIVSRPMCFAILRKKFLAREYQTWDALLDDMLLMFDNSMLYNPPDTAYYKQSKTLKEVAKKLVELGRRGVRNFRGKTAGVVRAHNAQLAADERAEKNAMKAAIRAQRLQLKNDKLLQKAAANGILFPASSAAPNSRSNSPWNLTASAIHGDGRRPLLPEEDTRESYHPSVKQISLIGQLGGLFTGRNADGVTFIGPPLQPVPRRRETTPAMYNRSVEEFISGLKGPTREYAMRKYGLA